MSRLDIRVKAGTKIIIADPDGKTITHESLTDTDIDHLYDVLAMFEQLATKRENGSER